MASPRAHHARGKLPGEAAEVQVGTDDVLHREAQIGEIDVAGDGHRLQVLQQRRTLVPRRALAAVDHVIAIQRADRDVDDVTGLNLGIDLRGESAEFVANGVENVLAELHQVHLVDRHDEVRNAQQRGEEGVAARLRQHAVARIDQDDGEVGGGGAGGHVARVLLVPGRVGDDELAPRRGEVAVGHVDGDALLALGAQAVGEQGEVEAVGGEIARGLAHAGQLVFVDALGIVEQAADQGALAIVHAARRGEAQEFGLRGGFQPCCGGLGSSPGSSPGSVLHRH